MTRLMGLVMCVMVGGIAHAEYLLSEIEYARLTGSARREYVGGLRSAYAQFEKSYVQRDDYYALLSLFPVAEAAERPMCLVGGVARYEVNHRCPTGGRECEGAPNSFLCGKIFGSACVPRQPTNTISERCESNAPADLGSDRYSEFSGVLQDAVAKTCSRRGKTSPQCKPLLEKMAALHVKYQVPALAQKDTPAAVKPANFDAKGICGGASYGQSENVCAACAFDHGVAQRFQGPQKAFHSSTKWMHLLTAMSKACDLSNIDGPLYDRMFDGKTSVTAATDLLATYGSCEDSAYDPSKDNHWWTSFRWPSKDGYVDPMTYAQEKSGKIPAVDIHKPDRFHEAFGVTMREAYDLFCPDGQKMSTAAAGYEGRLKKMSGRLGLEAYRCATDALELKKKMQVAVDRPCVPFDLASAAAPAGELRNALERSDAPQMVTMSYNGGTRCQIVSGFDSDGFTIRGAGGKIEHISARDINRNAVSILGSTCALAPRSATRMAQAKPGRQNVQPAAAGR